jgi:rare lipoprotein A
VTRIKATILAAAVALYLGVLLGSALAETASFYGGFHHGRLTANGERFNMHAMTAAHKTLRFGTRLRVSHAGRSVVVRINDRGPFIKGRDLDLSLGAARVLGMTKAGVVRVSISRM